MSIFLPLNYVDIGCSGGPKVSKIISDTNFYLGIDPLQEEVQRLAKKFQSYKNIKFLAGYAGKVGIKNFEASSYHLEYLAPFYAADCLLSDKRQKDFNEIISNLFELKKSSNNWQ